MTLKICQQVECQKRLCALFVIPKEKHGTKLMSSNCELPVHDGEDLVIILLELTQQATTPLKKPLK